MLDSDMNRTGVIVRKDEWGLLLSIDPGIGANPSVLLWQIPVHGTPRLHCAPCATYSIPLESVCMYAYYVCQYALQLSSMPPHVTPLNQKLHHCLSEST